jgi:hypothetical protein
MINRHHALGVLALAALSITSVTRAAEPSPRAIQTRIEALEAQVQSLKAEEQANQTAQATTRAVMTDAEQRSAVAPSAFTGGRKNGKFILQSADGRFSLNPNIQFQLRYVANNRNTADGSDTQEGFEVRRAKFGFAGNAFSKDLTYNFVWQASRSGGAVSLEEAWAKYRFADQWAVRGGLFKDPLSHEQQLSSKKQLAADRSLLNETLIGGDDFVEGIGLLYGGGKDDLHAEIALTDGSQSHNTDFRNAGADFGVAGRAEYKLFGDWKNYDDFSALANKHHLLVLGAGADLTQNGSTNAVLHTLDAQYELANGLAFYAAYVGRYTDSQSDDSVYDWGALGQVSYLIDGRHWEVFGRYDFIKLDDNTAGASGDFSELTAGVNYYFEGHNAKLTVDAVYLPDGAPADQTGIGVLASDGEQVLLRAQFQLLL